MKMKKTLSLLTAAAMLAASMTSLTAFADDSAAAAQLHELWNGLIFEGDSFTGKKDVLVERLQNIAEMIKPN